jgi:hypothetical protein
MFHRRGPSVVVAVPQRREMPRCFRRETVRMDQGRELLTPHVHAPTIRPATNTTATRSPPVR